MNTRLVILDRDGTVNRASDVFVKSPQEWEPLPGALQAIGRLGHAGVHVVVATNQSGLGRGLLDMAAVNAVHAHMQRQLAAAGGRIDAVFLCPHAPDEGCQCRKPAPGLLLQIGERYGVDLTQVPYVGDSLRDMQAAHAAGCMPHLVCTGRHADLAHLAGQLAPEPFPPGTRVHANLADCVAHLLGETPEPVSESRP